MTHWPATPLVTTTLLLELEEGGLLWGGRWGDWPLAPHTSSPLNCTFKLKECHCTVTLTKSSVTAMLWNKGQWKINWNFQRDTGEGWVPWKTLCGRGVDIVCQEHCFLFDPSDGPCAWIVITCESAAGLSCPTMNSTHHHLDDNKSWLTLASGWTRTIYYWSLFTLDLHVPIQRTSC